MIKPSMNIIYRVHMPGDTMTDDGLLHTAELLRTALPYVDIRSRLALELLVKIYDLLICIQNFRNNDISACGYENKEADIESLLSNIRPVCNESERVFVDKMLQVFQARRIFEMYNAYMEAMNLMNDSEGLGEGSEGSGGNDEIYENGESGHSENDSGPNDISSFLEELKAMMSPEQAQTYENLRMLFASDTYDDSNNHNESRE